MAILQCFFIQRKLSSLTGNRDGLHVVAKSRVCIFASRFLICLDETLDFLALDNIKRNWLSTGRRLRRGWRRTHLRKIPITVFEHRSPWVTRVMKRLVTQRDHWNSLKIIAKTLLRSKSRTSVINYGMIEIGYRSNKQISRRNVFNPIFYNPSFRKMTFFFQILNFVQFRFYVGQDFSYLLLEQREFVEILPNLSFKLWILCDSYLLFPFLGFFLTW